MDKERARIMSGGKDKGDASKKRDKSDKRDKGDKHKKEKSEKSDKKKHKKEVWPLFVLVLLFSWHLAVDRGCLDISI